MDKCELDFKILMDMSSMLYRTNTSCKSFQTPPTPIKVTKFHPPPAYRYYSFLNVAITVVLCIKSSVVLADPTGARILDRLPRLSLLQLIAWKLYHSSEVMTFLERS
jgi:hypothetical protein